MFRPRRPLTLLNDMKTPFPSLRSIRAVLPEISPSFSTQDKSDLAVEIEKRKTPFRWSINDRVFLIHPYFCEVNGFFYVDLYDGQRLDEI